MQKIVENARKMLEEDLESFPYTLDDPLGHSGTYRKIRDYIFACVQNDVSKSNCVDWLYDLYNEQTDEQHHAFQSKIDISANMLYEFHATIKE